MKVDSRVYKDVLAGYEAVPGENLMFCIPIGSTSTAEDNKTGLIKPKEFAIQAEGNQHSMSTKEGLVSLCEVIILGDGDHMYKYAVGDILQINEMDPITLREVLSRPGEVLISHYDVSVINRKPKNDAAV